MHLFSPGSEIHSYGDIIHEILARRSPMKNEEESNWKHPNVMLLQYHIEMDVVLCSISSIQ